MVSIPADLDEKPAIYVGTKKTLLPDGRRDGVRMSFYD
jgi:hypothetical protein